VALADRELLIAARDAAAAQSLLARTGVDATGVEWGTRVEDAVVVNATPIGMRGEQLPDELGDPRVGVFDMAYGAQPTPLVAAAVAAGLPYVDGESMLIAQAAKSFELWTDVTPDRAAMRAGLEAERMARNVR
jgi:shikimate 5-dehydrogenase